MNYSLVILNGPTPGAMVRLDAGGEEMTIGRDAACTMPVDDQLCSRLHARIWTDSSRWYIEDCGSRNGTRLNSQPIDRSELETGDLIRIGDRLIVFVEEGESSAADRMRPSKLAASTFVARVSEPAKREAMLQQLRTDSASRSSRDAAILCQLASRVFAQPNTESLVRLMIDTLRDATQADRIAVYLTGTNGRLRRVGTQHEAATSSIEPHVLANLALANDEALLVHQTIESTTATDRKPDDQLTREIGSAISVPIPGRTSRRGAIECYRSGSGAPFVHEDLDLAIAIAYQVGLAIENVERREQLELANEQLRQSVVDQSLIVGSSPAMAKLTEQISLVAPTTSTVLVLGESGTGKELVAQMIHHVSSRRAGPYIAVNCAAFTESLLDSELFGHEKGAFTGADRRRLGQFERANHGTMFLDEIGEMSLACQAKLLRVLEGHPFERLGGTEPIRVDVRIVAATHRDLSELVGKGNGNETMKFRPDLYYRLRVIELRVPPLRERGEDVLELAVHFLERLRRQMGRGPVRLSERAAAVIIQHPWPGNVRELKNSIERAVVLGQGDEVQPADLGLTSNQHEAAGPCGLISLADAERRHIQNVLDQVGGNKTQACEILGIGRGTLYKKLEGR
jgi:transcriptional regulator with GAF, ATPase, and Fis domain